MQIRKLTVLSSAVQTQQKTTLVLLILDTNGNLKPDEKVKLIIENKEDDSVEIKTAFDKVKD